MELAWKYVEYAGNHLLKVILKDIKKLTWKGRIIMKKRKVMKAIYKQAKKELQSQGIDFNQLYGK